MKNFLNICGIFTACVMGTTAYGVSAGTVTANTSEAGRAITTVGTTGSNTGMRGNQNLANAYKLNQRNTYYLVNVPDVDSACREKINKCFADYCGDVTVVPGQQSGRCARNFTTESELYNYALLCLRNDRTPLLPNYTGNTKMGVGGTNTAAQLCPSYIQQELMAYLSMANMADELSKARSPQCLKRRQELEAAMSCHSVALAYGNETSSMLTSQLNDFCGASVQGGSAEMVSRFANAGNVGANIWGWAEKVISLDLNKKADDWQTAVDAVLMSYANRMNLACGDNLQLNLTSSGWSNNANTTATGLSTAAAVAFPSVEKKTETPMTDLFMEIESYHEIYDYSTAQTVVNAGLANSVLTQNAFLSSSQMNDMQKAYAKGTKVFVIRDSSRCFIVPVATLSGTETSIMAQQFANCVYK